MGCTTDKDRSSRRVGERRQHNTSRCMSGCRPRAGSAQRQTLLPVTDGGENRGNVLRRHGTNWGGCGASSTQQRTQHAAEALDEATRTEEQREVERLEQVVRGLPRQQPAVVRYARRKAPRSGAMGGELVSACSGMRAESRTLPQRPCCSAAGVAGGHCDAPGTGGTSRNMLDAPVAHETQAQCGAPGYDGVVDGQIP